MVGSMWGGWNNWQLSWNRDTSENTVSLSTQSPSLADFYSIELFVYSFVGSSLFSFRFRWLSTWFHVYLLDWKYNKYLSFRMNTFWAREWESKRADSVYHHFRWIAKNSCFRAIFSSAHELESRRFRTHWP